MKSTRIILSWILEVQLLKAVKCINAGAYLVEPIQQKGKEEIN